MSAGMEPEAILGDLIGLDPALRRERYYGERSLFYNPGGRAPLGTIFCSVKDCDGPNDRASQLSRPGVFRFAFELSEENFERHLGPPPRRPPKGGRLELPDHDLAALCVLAPHPVYAWMRWAQILSPTAAAFATVRPLLDESLDLARQKWRRRRA